MISVNDRTKCCGCTVCSIVCPYDAISMDTDSLGFLYPKVDSQKCRDCGLCERVCSLHGKYKCITEFSVPEIFAARHKDETELMNSRSGALFVGLSDIVLSHNGSVYGAAFDSSFCVQHIRATTSAERDRMRGSKYVQSDVTGIFSLVKSDLENNLQVLFSGTPCQIAALKSFLGYEKVDDSNLLYVDIICHGVPAPNVWKDYLDYIEHKYNDKVLKAEFRDKKRHGWSAQVESFLLEKQGWISRKSFAYLFKRVIMFRPVCSACRYSSMNRPSDITLGDFWGWEQNVPDMNKDDKGVSLVLVNSTKGQMFINQLRDTYDLRAIENLSYTQPNLKSPSLFDPKWESFERDYSKRGFEYVSRKYGDAGVDYLVKRFCQKSRTAYRILRNKLGI